MHKHTCSRCGNVDDIKMFWCSVLPSKAYKYFMKVLHEFCISNKLLDLPDKIRDTLCFILMQHEEWSKVMDSQEPESVTTDPKPEPPVINEEEVKPNEVRPIPATEPKPWKGGTIV
jgi:tricorn protease-like protein